MLAAPIGEHRSLAEPDDPGIGLDAQDHVIADGYLEAVPSVAFPPVGQVHDNGFEARDLHFPVSSSR